MLTQVKTCDMVHQENTTAGALKQHLHASTHTKTHPRFETEDSFIAISVNIQ